MPQNPSRLYSSTVYVLPASALALVLAAGCGSDNTTSHQAAMPGVGGAGEPLAPPAPPDTTANAGGPQAPPAGPNPPDTPTSPETSNTPPGQTPTTPTPPGQTPPPPSGSAPPPATSSSAGDTGETTSAPPTGPGGTPGCEFEIAASISDAITTVGIVEWSLAGKQVSEAHIEFGLDETYGMTAPVEAPAEDNRTLLLGMKYERDYHYRIVATAEGEECTSADAVLTTGPKPAGLTDPDITTSAPEQLADGFLINARWGETNEGRPAFILDKEGDYVWSYHFPDDVIRARMSYDGRHMWLRNTAQMNGTGLVKRITMDGLEEETWEIPRSTHDLAVLPDGKIGLIGYADNGCHEIFEFDPSTGEEEVLFNVADAHGEAMCHVNYLLYYEPEDAYYISDWQTSSYIKIRRSGELEWVLNGAASDFSGTDWSRQHGLHVLGKNHLLIFSNDGRAGTGSLAIEYMLDDSAMSATELWLYDADISAPFGGDIQRLPNGNILVTYSSAGVIQQVNPETKEAIQELVFPLSFSVSYSEHRPSLYGGPPPKIHE